MTDHTTTGSNVAQPAHDLEARRRRAAYRASHRGTKEMDFLMGRFAQSRLAVYDSDTLARFERLLALPDPTLQEWIFSGLGFENVEFADIVRDIRACHGLEPADGRTS